MKTKYRDGGEGFILWCEDNVRVPIYPIGSDIPVWTDIGKLPDTVHPDTGRSYKQLWEEQKEIFRECLKMKKGKFVYTLIVLCWMRGEGKSFIACLIQLWKFFCFPKQQIMLGANSKDQVKFVHYDIMRDIISNSPKLLRIVGRKNIQEKEIRLRDDVGRPVSIIRAISSFSGIVSNITGYTFSEIFDMKNPKFYTQLDGSIRNIPNALGVIDSTVSTKEHVLYKLYDGVINKRTSQVYFSYRFSREGNQEDFWNPHMTQVQLNDYREKFPFGEFDRYFKNLWEAGRVQVITDAMVEEATILGIGQSVMEHSLIQKAIEEKDGYFQAAENFRKRKMSMYADQAIEKGKKIETTFRYVDSVIEKEVSYDYYSVGVDVLDRLSGLLDTDWSLQVGLDMADPMAVRRTARSILSLTAKGLPGSKITQYITGISNEIPRYVYILIGLVNVLDHSLEKVKEVIDRWDAEYHGIDSFCAERYGVWDMEQWAEERGILLEMVYPSYGRQREAFKELYNVFSTGRFKMPVIEMTGSKSNRLFEEELKMFIHDPDTKWFGSPEKKELRGTQDDSVYSVAWSMYGGRTIGYEAFRPRMGIPLFGEYYQNKNLVANY